jgi:[acyl-carrier-protein] S-malonyltransferase
MKAALLFPGQGSQFVGMTRNLYQTNVRVKSLIDNASEQLGLISAGNGSHRMSLKHLLMECEDANLLRETAIAQPMIVLASLAAYEAARDNIANMHTIAYLGHSLGEYSALVVAGALAPNDALRLVMRFLFLLFL